LFSHSGRDSCSSLGNSIGDFFGLIKFYFKWWSVYSHSGTSSAHQKIASIIFIIHSIFSPTTSRTVSKVNQTTNFCTYYATNLTATKIYSDCIFVIFSLSSYFSPCFKKILYRPFIFLSLFSFSQYTNKKRKRKERNDSHYLLFWFLFTLSARDN
jgi:hypothetical protein